MLSEDSVVLKCKAGTWTGVSPDNQCPNCGSECEPVQAVELDRKIADFEAGYYEWEEYDKKNPRPENWQPHPHPGYSAMIAWAKEQGRCWKHPLHLANSYRKHTGNQLDMRL